MTGHDDTATAPTVVGAVAPPSPAEIEAAVRILMRAWSPSTPLPGDPDVDADDVYEEYDNGCGCAGEDEDGADLGCNCGAGCSCTSCEAVAWQWQKRCSAGNALVGMHCGQTVRYRVIAYRLVATSISDSSEGVVCPHPADERCHCKPGCVFVDAGPLPSVHQYFSACSVAHAQRIVARMQEVYDEPDDKPTRLRYRIEAWTYEPHWTELPEPLAALRELTGGARDYVGLAIRDDGPNVDYWLAAVRENLALAAWRAARPVPEDLADDVADAETAAP